MKKTTKKKTVPAKSGIDERKHWGKLPDESLISWIIRIFKMIKWVVILGIPGTVAACITLYLFFKPYIFPEQYLREQISQRVEIVNDTFKPNDLANDTSKYASLLKDYQETVLDFCALWKSIDHVKTYAEYYKDMNMNYVDLWDLITDVQEKITVIVNKRIEINKKLKRIVVYESLTDSNSQTPINTALSIEIDTLEKWGSQELKDEANNVFTYIDEAKANKKDIIKFKKSFEKLVDSLDKIRNNVNLLKAYLTILDYAIDCNSLLLRSKRHYSKITPYRDCHSWFSSLEVSEDTLNLMLDIYYDLLYGSEQH